MGIPVCKDHRAPFPSRVWVLNVTPGDDCLRIKHTSMQHVPCCLCNAKCLPKKCYIALVIGMALDLIPCLPQDEHCNNEPLVGSTPTTNLSLFSFPVMIFNVVIFQEILYHHSSLYKSRFLVSLDFILCLCFCPLYLTYVINNMTFV